jgi:hypothetical protein
MAAVETPEIPVAIAISPLFGRYDNGFAEEAGVAQWAAVGEVARIACPTDGVPVTAMPLTLATVGFG